MVWFRIYFTLIIVETGEEAITFDDVVQQGSHVVITFTKMSGKCVYVPEWHQPILSVCSMIVVLVRYLFAANLPLCGNGGTEGGEALHVSAFDAP